MFYTYIVTNRRNGKLYTGHTDDMNRRSFEHRHSYIQGWSKDNNCIHLVWYEIHETRDAAFKRERRIKKWERSWKLRMIEDMNPLWLDLGLIDVWPLPDRDTYPQIWANALVTALSR